MSLHTRGLVRLSIWLMMVLVFMAGTLGWIQPVQAGTFGDSYDLLKIQYPLLVQRFLSGGATEADIHSFLNDLESQVAARGPLTDANFDSVMYAAFQETVAWKKNRAVFQALLEQFPVEVDYTMQHDALHPNLIPLRNAVKQAVLNPSGLQVVPVPPAPLSNVPKPIQPVWFDDLIGHWAESDIYTMAQLGLVEGVGANQFAPDRKITRAELTALLVRAAGVPETTLLQSRFLDVPAQQWYFAPVNLAAQAGLVNGFSVTDFRPEWNVTREQMTVMLANAMIYRGVFPQLGTDQEESVLAGFADEGFIAVWARSSAANTVDAGIIEGRGQGIFAPGEMATRAEAAVMILRFYRWIAPEKVSLDG